MHFNFMCVCVCVWEKLGQRVTPRIYPRNCLMYTQKPRSKDSGTAGDTSGGQHERI